MFFSPLLSEPRRRGLGAWIARGATLALCLAHSALVWVAIGGREGVSSEWPPLWADHGLHYHQAAVTRTFLATTGTTAGYDPSFMAGYPASIVSDLSSSLPDLVAWAFGASRPEVAYKLYAFGCTALLPWIVAATAMACRLSPRGVAAAVLFYVLYFWCDAPAGTVGVGMVSYTVSVPLGLLATAAIAAYVARGGFGRWLLAAAAAAAVLLVHVTSPMLVGPAGLAAYAVAIVRGRREGQRPLGHAAPRALGDRRRLALAANVFVGGCRACAAGLDEGGLHAGVRQHRAGPRPARGDLLGGRADRGGPPRGGDRRAPDLVAAATRRGGGGRGDHGARLRVGLPRQGFSRVLADPLQPGRHTAALYTSACLAAGVFLDEALERLRAGGPGRLDRWVLLTLVVMTIRFFGPYFRYSARELLAGEGPRPFLSTRATPRLLWIVNRVRKHVRPGERLLYEEAGREIYGQPDPFQGRHYSPVLPLAAGVEVLGGPYLHATVTTNFTQFGEGRLFGEADWDRDYFVRYARLYRPAAILCWSPHARAFCRANPDLVRIVEDDGGLMLGRVLGFEGATIRGKAEVTATPNRIEVRDAVAGDDGLVVLRYHAVPLLRSDPPVDWEPVYLEDDPVPFIAFRPNGGTVVFSMKPAPWSGAGR